MAMNMHGKVAGRYKLILVDCNFLSRAKVLNRCTVCCVIARTEHFEFLLMTVVVKTTTVTVESEIYK